MKTGARKGLIQQVFKHLDGAGETGNWLREQKILGFAKCYLLCGAAKGTSILTFGHIVKTYLKAYFPQKNLVVQYTPKFGASRKKRNLKIEEKMLLIFSKEHQNDTYNLVLGSVSTPLVNLMQPVSHAQFLS